MEHEARGEKSKLFFWLFWETERTIGAQRREGAEVVFFFPKRKHKKTEKSFYLFPAECTVWRGLKNVRSHGETSGLLVYAFPGRELWVPPEDSSYVGPQISLQDNLLDLIPDRERNGAYRAAYAVLRIVSCPVPGTKKRRSAD